MTFYRLTRDTPIMPLGVTFRVVDTIKRDDVISFHIVAWSNSFWSPKSLAKVSHGVVTDGSVARKMTFREVVRWIVRGS